jgi:hypothetical protein
MQRRKSKGKREEKGLATKEQMDEKVMQEKAVETVNKWKRANRFLPYFVLGYQN